MKHYLNIGIVLFFALISCNKEAEESGFSSENKINYNEVYDLDLDPMSHWESSLYSIPKFDPSGNIGMLTYGSEGPMVYSLNVLNGRKSIHLFRPKNIRVSAVRNTYVKGKLYFAEETLDLGQIFLTQFDPSNNREDWKVNLTQELYEFGLYYYAYNNAVIQLIMEMNSKIYVFGEIYNNAPIDTWVLIYDNDGTLIQKKTLSDFIVFYGQSNETNGFDLFGLPDYISDGSLAQGMLNRIEVNESLERLSDNAYATDIYFTQYNNNLMHSAYGFDVFNLYYGYLHYDRQGYLTTEYNHYEGLSEQLYEDNTFASINDQGELVIAGLAESQNGFETKRLFLGKLNSSGILIKQRLLPIVGEIHALHEFPNGDVYVLISYRIGTSNVRFGIVRTRI